MTAFLDRANRNGWLTAAALVTALLLGGGGSPDPIGELMVQLAVAAIAIIWVISLDVPPGKAVPRSAWTIAALLLIVPLVQLIPLPPMLWQSLPGRAAERAALALIGRENEWRAISLAPARTLASLLAIVPAALVLIMASALDRRGKGRLLAAMAAGGVLTILLGAAQLSGGADSPLRFHNAGSTYLEGFQANHNSTADVLLIALLATMALIRHLASSGFFRSAAASVPLLGLGAATLFGLAVFLSGSRAGILLLAPALAAAGLMLRPWLNFSRRGLALGLGGLAALAVAAFAAGLSNPALAKVAARFGLGEELRPELWADSIFTARGYFPFGAGMGDFVPAVIANERLEIVRINMPNRAHNELLELLVESGIFGVLVVAGIAALLTRSCYRSFKADRINDPGHAMFGISAFLILALHSLVDYPFRSMSLAITAAVAAALMLPIVAASPRHRPEPLG